MLTEESLGKLVHNQDIVVVSTGVNCQNFVFVLDFFKGTIIFWLWLLFFFYDWLTLFI